MSTNRLNQSFGKNLRKVRRSLGMTAAELAERAGLTPAAISQIENDKRGVTLASIIKILKVIPVKFEKLVEDK